MDGDLGRGEEWYVGVVMWRFHPRIRASRWVRGPDCRPFASSSDPGFASIFCCVRDGGYKVRCSECPLSDTSENASTAGPALSSKKAAAIDAARRRFDLSEDDFDAWLLGLRPNLVKDRFRAKAKEVHPDTAIGGDGSSAAFQELQRCHDILLEALGQLAAPVSDR